MAISVISSTSKDAGVVSTATIGKPPSPVGGGAIIVCVGGYNPATASTVYDDAGNTYLKAIQSSVGNPDNTASIWYALNISSALTTISATLNGAVNCNISALHVTGLSTGSPLVGTTSSNTGPTSSSNHSAATLTPSTQGIAVSYTNWNGVGGGNTTGASYTGFPSTASYWAVEGNFSQYWIQTTPAATDGAFTTSGKTKSLSVLAYFADTVLSAASYYAPPAFLQLGLQH